MIGVFELTLRELLARKVIVALFVVITVMWGLLAFALQLDVVEGGIAGIRVFGENQAPNPDPESTDPMANLLSLERFVVEVQRVVAGICYWLGILLALFATAPTINQLLERGRVDLLLSKPISRPAILGGHLLAVLCTVFALGLYLFGMVWLVMSLKTGVWNLSFFAALGIVCAVFATMYSVVLFIGVWIQSTAISLIVTYGLIFASLILATREQLLPQLNYAGRLVFEAAYHLFPNFAEVTMVVVQLSANEPVTGWYPLIATLLFGVFVYGAAVLLFSRRDF